MQYAVESTIFCWQKSKVIFPKLSAKSAADYSPPKGTGDLFVARDKKKSVLKFHPSLLRIK
jgi:hypothetical protein